MVRCLLVASSIFITPKGDVQDCLLISHLERLISEWLVKIAVQAGVLQFFFVRLNAKQYFFKEKWSVLKCYQLLF